MLTFVSNLVRDLPVSKQKELWSGVVKGKLASYWNVWKDVSAALENASSTAHSYFPVRLLIRQPGDSRLFCRQLPVRVEESPASMVTLRDVIEMYVNADRTLFPESLLQNTSRIRTAGISPSLDAPIRELCHTLALADGFLYVCIV